MTYCPGCISFREECNPEEEDYNKPCPYFKSANEVYEAEVRYERELSERMREAEEEL